MRSTEFRQVYDRGRKFTCPYFAAFFVAGAEGSGPRVGFTTPRALGKAVVRNRVRRRVREAVRPRLGLLSSQWSIVINPRRKALDAPFAELEREVERLFRHCNEL